MPASYQMGSLIPLEVEAESRGVRAHLFCPWLPRTQRPTFGGWPRQIPLPPGHQRLGENHRNDEGQRYVTCRRCGAGDKVTSKYAALLRYAIAGHANPGPGIRAGRFRV